MGKTYAFKTEEGQELVNVLAQINTASEVATSQVVNAIKEIIDTDEYLRDCQFKDEIIKGADPIINALEKVSQDTTKMKELVSKAVESWQVQLSTVNKKTSDVSDALNTAAKHLHSRS